MINAGMNVARLNFSHGAHAEHQVRIDNLRQASALAKQHLAIMLDTKRSRNTYREAKGRQSTPGDRTTIYPQQPQHTRLC
jgi:pyruvate kinase